MQVWACFEFFWCDAPILRAIKTTGPAIAWRDADVLNRFVMPFTLDHEREAVMEQGRMRSESDDSKCN